MKWPWKKKDEPSEQKHCCTCGGVITRQTKLTEFGLKFELPKGQKTLLDYGLQMTPTQRVGMQNEIRKYRRSI